VIVVGEAKHEGYAGWADLAAEEREEFTPPEPVDADDLMSKIASL
jgi:hypothetical protein